MLDEIVADAEESMDKAVESFNRDLTKLRTGRANLQMLDGIRVEYYGTPSPLNQVASLNIPDPRLITIKPWDKTLLTAVEKALVASNLGLTPNNDGELIRLPIPRSPIVLTAHWPERRPVMRAVPSGSCCCST